MLMKKQFAIAGLFSLLSLAAAASDDRGPGGNDIRVQEFVFKGSVGAWKHDNTYPVFWIRRWKQGHAILVAERFKCGTERASQPRAKLDGQQLAVWIDLEAKPWPYGQCEYRSLFMIDNLSEHISPIIINGVYGVPQPGWPDH